jgi:predicted deacetylase
MRLWRSRGPAIFGLLSACGRQTNPKDDPCIEIIADIEIMFDVHPTDLVKARAVATVRGQRRAYARWARSFFQARRKVGTLIIGTQADFQARKTNTRRRERPTPSKTE